MQELTIDREFEAAGRRLRPEEESFLEQSLTDDGCLDPIIVWANHDYIILDGHNRYRICKQLGISFKIRAITLADRDACLDWIDRHQLGKRNLTDLERSEYEGRIYNRRKKKHGVRGPEKMDHSEPSSTAEVVAKELGTSPATIKRSGQFVEALDKIEKNAGRAVKDEILSGRSGLSKKEVVAIAKEPAAKQAEAVEVAKRDKPRTGEIKTDVERLIEGIEKLIERVNALAAHRMGHNAQSRAVVATLKEAIKRSKAMARSWRNE